MVAPPISKARRRRLSSSPDGSAALVGRRVQVPQQIFFPDDDERFFFGGTIKAATKSRLLILFDYTGEEEWHATPIATRWLEPDISPLCTLLGSSCTADEEVPQMKSATSLSVRSGAG